MIQWKSNMPEFKTRFNVQSTRMAADRARENLRPKVDNALAVIKRLLMSSRFVRHLWAARGQHWRAVAFGALLSAVAGFIGLISLNQPATTRSETFDNIVAILFIAGLGIVAGTVVRERLTTALEE
jgi:hypothetical protein